MLTIDVKDLLLCLLIFAGIILAIYLIYAIYKLIKTLERSQKVLSELEVVVRITSKRTQELDKIIDQMSKKLKTGQGIFNAIPIIFQTIAKIAKVIGQQQNAGGNK